MVEVVAHAFLSYAHADNDRECGRILRLAQLIADEFESLTGTKIDIFTDAGIKWGQDFRSKLNDALRETTFFIPVLTPTYFLREECRKEITQFAATAKALGLDELLLSIRYINVGDMQEGSTDELKDLAARMQYEAWDDLRLEDESSAAYRKAINRLAQRLVGVTSNLEAKPVDVDADKPGSSERADNRRTTHDDERDAGVLDDEAPGALDLAADLQPAMEALTAITTALTPPTERWTSLLNESTKKMIEANSKPNSFAAKIVAAREFARDAEETLVEMENLSKEYSTALLRLDPRLRAVLTMVATSSDDADDVEPYLASTQGMVDAALESADTMVVAATSAQDAGSLSRDLRPVFRRYATAVRNIADGRSIIESWQPLIDAARAQHGLS